MKRNEAKNIIALSAVIAAFANGKTIQFDRDGRGNWKDVADPGFRQAPSKYRIKPERKKVRVVMYAIARFDDGAFFIRKSLKNAKTFAAKQTALGFDVEIHPIIKEI